MTFATVVDALIANVQTMHETINEPIKVLATFASRGLKPLSFEWRGKRYAVKDIDLVHVAKDGDARVYYFDVTNDPNHFSLSLHTGTMEWKLNELYYEG